MADANEGWRDEAKRIGLQSHHIRFLNDIVPIISSFSISIILVGSWSRECASNDSDLDLLIITPNRSSKIEVLSIIREYETSNIGFQQLCDFKVLTKVELDDGERSPHFFIFWTWLKYSRILYGSDLRNQFNLDKERLADVLGDLSRRMEECRLNLEEYSMFRGSCVTLVEAINTLFFVEQMVIDNKSKKMKTEFLHTELGILYPHVMKVYYEITENQNNTGLGFNYSFNREHDRKYSSKLYDQLSQTFLAIETKLNSIRKNLYSIN